MTKYPLLALLFLLIPGCLLIKPATDTTSEHDPDSSFENYYTYSMVSTEFTSSTPLYKDVIEEQISRMLEVRGYRQNTINPDLIVFYKLFPGKVSINTLKKTYNRHDQLKIKPNVSLAPTRTTLQGGVLVIHLIDAKKSSPVWQGHASGILEIQPDKKEIYIRHKIRLLFDKYDYFAHGFLTSRYKAKPSRETMPSLILQRQGYSIK